MHSFPRLLCFAGALLLVAGCSSTTEKRLVALENTAQNQQVLDMRVSRVEDRLTRVEDSMGPQPVAVSKPAPVVEKKYAVAPEVQEKPVRQSALAAEPQVVGIIKETPGRATTPNAANGYVGAVMSPESGAAPFAFEPTSGGRKVVPSAGTTRSMNVEPQPAPVRQTPISQAPVVSEPSGRRAGSSAYDAAYALYNKGQYAQAQQEFSSFLQSAPRSSLAPNAMYWIGECQYSLGKFDTAIMSFKDVAAKYPKHDKAAASLLKAGYSYAKLGDMNNARFYWQILLDDFPRSSSAAMAKKRMTEG